MRGSSVRRAVLLALLAVGACVGGPGRGAVSGPPSSGGPASTTTSPAPGAIDLEEALRATVRVVVDACAGGRMGSGFLVDDHTVLTNRHVVSGARQIRIETADGTRLGVLDATESSYADIGIVHVEPTDIRPLQLAPTDIPRGTPVRVLGYPLDGPLTTTGGLVAEYVVEASINAVDPVLRLNVDLNPGNSGGPVLEPDGRVAGIAYASELATGYGLAIPASAVSAARRDTAAIHPVEPCS